MKHHHRPPHHHPPHHHPPRHHGHHAGERLLNALEVLLDTGYIATTADLATAAEGLGETASAARLREMEAQDLPPHLALDKLRVQLDEESFHRMRQMIEAARRGALGLILPLPPHIFEVFLPIDSVQILSTDHHEPPPHLRSRLAVIRGARACREVVAGLDTAVFEARKPNGAYLISPETADIIDSRILKQEAQLVVHLGPHSHPDDVPLAKDLAARLKVL